MSRYTELLRFFLFVAVVLCFCGWAFGEDLAQDDALLDMSLEELMDIEVDTVYAASKYTQKVTEAPSSITVISSDEIAKFGYRTLADALRSVRGLYVSNDRNYSYLGVRGFSLPGDYNNRVLVLVDGYRLNDNIYDMGYIGETFILDIDLVDRIEVVRGPGSSLYGSSAFFAVINVVSKSGADIDGVEVSGSAGSFGTYKGRGTYGARLSDDLEVLFSYSGFDSDGQKLNFKEFGTTNGTDSQDFEKFFSKIKWGKFTFTSAYSSRTKGIPTAPWGVVFDDDRTESRDRTGYFDLKYEEQLEDTLRFMGRAYYGYYRSNGDYLYDWDTPYVLNQGRFNGSWMGGEAQFVKELDCHRLIWGAEYKDNRKQDMRNKDVNPGFVYTYLDDEAESEQWAVYMQDEYKFSDQISFTAGLRYDNYSSFGATTSPRLAMVYSPSEKTFWKLIYGEAFRAPSVSEYNYEYDDGSTVWQAASSLDPESITTYELVLEQYISEGLWATVTAYYYEIDDLIVAEQLSAGPPEVKTMVNGDTVKAAGVEGELHGHWDNGWHGMVSYSYTDTEDTGNDDKRLANSSRHLAKANLIVPLIKEKLFAGFEAQYESSRDTLAGNKTGDSIIANLTMLYKDDEKGFELSTGVYNLFDENFSNPGFSEHTQDTLEQDGLSVRVKATWRF